jgi:hypothetical protein
MIWFWIGSMNPSAWALAHTCESFVVVAAERPHAIIVHAAQREHERRRLACGVAGPADLEAAPGRRCCVAVAGAIDNAFGANYRPAGLVLDHRARGGAVLDKGFAVEGVIEHAGVGFGGHSVQQKLHRLQLVIQVGPGNDCETFVPRSPANLPHDPADDSRRPAPLLQDADVVMPAGRGDPAKAVGLLDNQRACPGSGSGDAGRYARRPTPGDEDSDISGNGAIHGNRGIVHLEEAALAASDALSGGGGGMNFPFPDTMLLPPLTESF